MATNIVESMDPGHVVGGNQLTSGAIPAEGPTPGTVTPDPDPNNPGGLLVQNGMVLSVGPFDGQPGTVITQVHGDTIAVINGTPGQVSEPVTPCLERADDELASSPK